MPINTCLVKNINCDSLCTDCQQSLQYRVHAKYGKNKVVKAVQFQ
jgi:hypothetical protein